MTGSITHWYTSVIYMEWVLQVFFISYDSNFLDLNYHNFRLLERGSQEPPTSRAQWKFLRALRTQCGQGPGHIAGGKIFATCSSYFSLASKDQDWNGLWGRNDDDSRRWFNTRSRAVYANATCRSMTRGRVLFGLACKQLTVERVLAIDWRQQRLCDRSRTMWPAVLGANNTTDLIGQWFCVGLIIKKILADWMATLMRRWVFFLHRRIVTLLEKWVMYDCENVPSTRSIGSRRLSSLRYCFLLIFYSPLLILCSFVWYSTLWRLYSRCFGFLRVAD